MAVAKLYIDIQQKIFLAALSNPGQPAAATWYMDAMSFRIGIGRTGP